MSGSEIFFDRFTRQWATDPPLEVALSSQLIVQGPATVAGDDFRGLANIVENGSGVAVVEANGRQWSIRLLRMQHRDSMKSALAISQNIRDARDLNFSEREVVESVDPIVLLQDISELLKSSPLEKALEENAPKLRSVFYEPFTELELQPIRLPASRARRISRRAIQVLSARSEDWLRMSVSGITPRTIEALEREDVLDIYENRVAARLIDEVRLHLKSLRDFYAELTPLLQKISGPFRKMNRSANLWGDKQPDEIVRDALKTRQDEVRSLLHLTEELRDTRLYRGIPTRARVSQPIRSTNLLQQDASYRGVYSLWFAWWKSRREGAAADERHGQILAETEAFYDYCWLVTIRALVNMEYLAETVSTEIGSFTSTSPWATVGMGEVPSFDEGTFEITCTPILDPAKKSTVLVISLACEVLKYSNSEIRNIVGNISDAVEVKKNQDVLILFPGTALDFESQDAEISEAPAFSPLQARRGVGRRDLWVMAVSPLDLGSAERVERAIRWMVLREAFLAYPPVLAISGDANEAVGTQSFLEIAVDESTTEMVGIPTNNELVHLEADLGKKRRALEQKLRGDGLVEAQNIERALEQIVNTRQRLVAFNTCPVCGSSGVFEQRSNKTFEAKCRSCSSRWGLRHDPSSADRIPYLWLGEDLASLPPANEVGSWVGRDILSEPCQSLDAEYGAEVINPWTGRCTSGPVGATECLRCNRSEKIT